MVRSRRARLAWRRRRLRAEEGEGEVQREVEAMVEGVSECPLGGEEEEVAAGISRQARVRWTLARWKRSCGSRLLGWSDSLRLMSSGRQAERCCALSASSSCS